MRLLLAVNGEGGGGKKGKKKGERRRGGSQGLGKSATNGINQIRTLRCAKTSKTAAFNRRGVRRASIQPKREYKSVTNVLQYSQTARELFFLPSFFFFSNSREKSGGKIIGAPTYLNALQFLTSFVLFFFFTYRYSRYLIPSRQMYYFVESLATLLLKKMFVEGWNHDWFRETNRYNLRLVFFFYNKKREKWKKEGKRSCEKLCRVCVERFINYIRY